MSNDKIQMSNQILNPNDRKGENIVRFYKSVRQDAISRSIVNQIVRSGTSIGANYMEANAASSKRDFRNKIYICKKETQETKHWLRMLAVVELGQKEQMRRLWSEAQELTLIFQKITNSLNRK